MKLEKLDIDYYVEDRICRLLKVERGFFIEVHEKVYNHFNLREKGEGTKNDKSNSNLYEYSSTGNYS